MKEKKIDCNETKKQKSEEGKRASLILEYYVDIIHLVLNINFKNFYSTKFY